MLTLCSMMKKQGNRPLASSVPIYTLIPLTILGMLPIALGIFHAFFPELPFLEIVHLSEDVMTPVKHSQFLQANLVNSQLRIIKGTGHMCMMEKPAEVTEIIESFLASSLMNS